MKKITKYSICIATAYTSVIWILAIIAIGFIDYSRGSNFTPYEVEKCTSQDCLTSEVNARRILDAVDYQKRGEDFENLCATPQYIYNKRMSPDQSDMITEAFDVTGIAIVDESETFFSVVPGRNVDSVMDAFLKIFNPEKAKSSCYTPWIRWYGLLIFLFSIITFIAFAISLRYRKQ